MVGVVKPRALILFADTVATTNLARWERRASANAICILTFFSPLRPALNQAFSHPHQKDDVALADVYETKSFGWDPTSHSWKGLTIRD